MARPALLLKRLIKLTISLFVRFADLLRIAGLRVLGRIPAPACVVLYYHAVNASQRKRFARQLDHLLRLARPISVGSSQKLLPGCRYAGVTFDDGFVSVLENALPEIEARRIPATMFVPTGSLGDRPAWVRNSATPAYQQIVASRQQLAGLKDHPLLAIQSHSVSHPNFLLLDPSQAQSEFRQSREELERILGKSVNLFSFPHGKHNARLIEMAENAGYHRMFTINPAMAFQNADEKVVGRVLADPGDWLIEFRLKVLGAYRWLACLC